MNRISILCESGIALVVAFDAKMPRALQIHFYEDADLAENELNAFGISMLCEAFSKCFGMCNLYFSQNGYSLDEDYSSSSEALMDTVHSTIQRLILYPEILSPSIVKS